MMSNKEGLAFFHNIKLISVLIFYWQVRCPLPFALVNNENKIFKIPSSVIKVFECHHKKVDTRMILHVLQQ